jgi:ABC-type multidrug transport system ATPase subunit
LEPLKTLNSGIKLEVSSLEYKAWNKKILGGNLNFSIFSGEFVGLLGPSGSGKSTLLKSCCGLIKPSSGQILMNGENFYENPSKWRNKIGYVPQDDIIHQELSVEKAIFYSAKLRLPSDLSLDRKKALTSKVIAEVGLSERASLKIKKLSGGQRKRASIAVELLNNPEILFLDEPTSGQDPQLEEALMKLFKQMSQKGTSVIVTTHAMASIEMLDLVLLVQEGRLVYFGPPQELLNFFDSRSYEGVFKNLVKDKPENWVEKYRNSLLYNKYIISSFGNKRTR